jgi:biopolymer transport protein ExbD
MAFGNFGSGSAQTPNAEINMVPLIDVMLVLLVIFIITAPLLTHSVKIDLPRVSSQPNPTQPDHIQLAVRADGEVFWNGETVNFDTLTERMRESAAKDPQPELHIRADRTTEYQKVAKILGLAARVGLSKIGFVSDPEVQAP